MKRLEALFYEKMAFKTDPPEERCLTQAVACTKAALKIFSTQQPEQDCDRAYHAIAVSHF